MKGGRRAVLVLAGGLLGAACVRALRPQTDGPTTGSARVEVYLKPHGGQQAGELVLEVAAARLVDGSGEAHPLHLARGELSSGETRRTLLASAEVEPLGYRELVLSLRAAGRVVDGSRHSLTLLPQRGEEGALSDAAVLGDAQEYTIPVALRVRPREAAALFVAWDVDASRLEGGLVRPAFAPTVEHPRASVGLLYVSDAASGAVLVIDRSSRDVVGTARVEGAPSGLALSDDRRFLFASNAGTDSLSVVDLRENFATSTIPLRISSHAQDVAVLGGTDGVATANERLDTVSFFDAARSLRGADVAVPRAPVRLAAAPRLRRLFVLCERAEQLVAIDLNARQLVGTLPLEADPSDLALDARGELLFVAHATSRNLLVVDARRLQVLSSIFVGGDATAVLADRRRDRVYVATASPPELLLVDLRVAAIVRRIPISGVVRALEQPLDGPYVYGACPEEALVVVVNVISGREAAPITDVARPTDVVAVD